MDDPAKRKREAGKVGGEWSGRSVARPDL